MVENMLTRLFRPRTHNKRLGLRMEWTDLGAVSLTVRRVIDRALSGSVLRLAKDAGARMPRRTGRCHSVAVGGSMRFVKVVNGMGEDACQGRRVGSVRGSPGREVWSV